MPSLLDNRFLQAYFNLIRRFIPTKPEGTSVGLDIASKECKIVQVAKSGNDFRLVDWAIQPMNGSNAAETIQKMLGDLKEPYTSIYTSVFGKGTLIRYISMPRMSMDELKTSFEIEADKYFPFAQDQIYTDCCILDEQGKEKQMAVMAAAAKKEIIDDRVKLLDSVGIKPDFIGINPIALANVINVLGIKDEPDQQSAVALLDMGESVSNLSILIDRRPYFTRDIFIGGQDLTKRISSAMNISFEDAEKLKRDPGDKAQELLDVCEAAISNVVKELRLSFDYFGTEKNKDVSCLLLTGGGSMLNEIYKVFEKNLEVPVKQWNPLDSLEGVSEESKKEMGNRSLKMGVALGLALYDYD